MNTSYRLGISWKSSSGKQKTMHVYLPDGIYSHAIDRSASVLSHGGELNAIITMAMRDV